MRRQVAAVVVAGAMAFWHACGNVARAGDEEDALVGHALQLRRAGNDRAALDELQRAYAIKRSPRAAAQLGFAEQALGMWPQAEAHVGEALAAERDPWVRKNRPTVEAALATIRAHVGHVQIDGAEPGAQVSVNGQAAGSIPLRDAVPVSAGPVDIEVRAAGYAPAFKTVNVAAGELTRVPFTLQPLARAPAAPPPFRPGATAAAAVTPLPAPLVAETHVDRGRRERITGIALMAGGVVAVGGGVIASVVAKNKFDAIGADAAADRPFNESNGNWKSYEAGAGVLYAVGGAAILGGVVLYVAGRPTAEASRPPAVSSIAVRPTVASGRAGASLAVRF